MPGSLFSEIYNLVFTLLITFLLTFKGFYNERNRLWLIWEDVQYKNEEKLEQ
jgi:hypothetical protein